jgi:hypothetical protein
MSAKKKTREGSAKSFNLLGGVVIPLAALVVGWLTFRGTGPTLYQSDPAVTGEFFTLKVTNKGRAAQVGQVWCGAGAYLTPASAKITKLVNESPDIFRYTALAPDQQVSLEMWVPVSVNPELASRLNPLFLRLNSSTSWGVACNIPYWDTLDKWKLLEQDLKFCYEVQPTNTGTQRHAVMCTADELSRTIRELGGPQ